MFCCETDQNNTIKDITPVSTGPNHNTKLFVLFLFQLHCLLFASACKHPLISSFKWTVHMLSLLSLLENFCNFLSDQTASESSQSLSCLCAFACSPQLLQILFLMLSGFLSLLFPDSYDHCFNLGGSSLQWGVNKEDYNMQKTRWTVFLFRVFVSIPSTLSCTAVSRCLCQLVNTTHWGVTWVLKGAHPISHLATTTLPSHHETLDSAPCLVPPSMQSCPCRKVYW